jgi:hypothetical protein
MSNVESSSSWKHLSSATKAAVIAGVGLAAAVVVWLNFIH